MPPQVSIIIPTINEAENLPLLVPRIAAAMAGRSYEILIVDDNSRDNTPAVCIELAQQFPLKLLVRTNPKNGLSGAVLHGMALAQGDYFLVMDADLQHPPERIPDLLQPLQSNLADFTLGSRHVAGGSTEGRWGFLRRLNSWGATLLARPFAGNISDPMSGFFALSRQTFQNAQRLTPLGYKIALELMCKCRVNHVLEIPIHFGTRAKGQSKLSLKQQFRYLEHLSRLYDFTFPRLSPAIKFLIATACAWLVGLVLFLLLILSFRIPPVPSTFLAYLVSIFITALFHMRYVRTQREFLIRPRPWLDFSLISLAELFTCILTTTWLVHRLPSPTLAELFLLPFSLATLIRYVLRKELLQDIRGLRRDPRFPS